MPGGSHSGHEVHGRRAGSTLLNTSRRFNLCVAVQVLDMGPENQALGLRRCLGAHGQRLDGGAHGPGGWLYGMQRLGVPSFLSAWPVVVLLLGSVTRHGHHGLRITRPRKL